MAAVTVQLLKALKPTTRCYKERPVYHFFSSIFFLQTLNILVSLKPLVLKSKTPPMRISMASEFPLFHSLRKLHIMFMTSKTPLFDIIIETYT